MTPQTDLADRYGAPAPWRRRVADRRLRGRRGGVPGLAGLDDLVAVDPARSAPRSSATTSSTSTPPTATVEVRLADDDVVATCTLRAYAEDHTVVGELSFTPEAAGRSEQTVRTERRATSVELIGCTAPGQNRPR